MSADYQSISDGIVLVSTIIGWNLAIDWLAFRFPQVRRVLQAPELVLVRDGNILHRNLRRELMTVEELMAKLRAEGLEDIKQVRVVYMESDGTVSVIKK